MSVVEIEKTTVVPVVPTDEEKVLMEMIRRVRDGQWCRNSWRNDQNQMCALGLIDYVTATSYL